MGAGQFRVRNSQVCLTGTERDRCKLVEMDPEIGYHAGWTLLTTPVGFRLAVVGGMGLGVAIGASRIVYSGLYPLLIGFNSVPKSAIIPVLVIWF